MTSLWFPLLQGAPKKEPRDFVTRASGVPAKRGHQKDKVGDTKRHIVDTHFRGILQTGAKLTLRGLGATFVMKRARNKAAPWESPPGLKNDPYPCGPAQSPACRTEACRSRTRSRHTRSVSCRDGVPLLRRSPLLLRSVRMFQTQASLLWKPTRVEK